MFDPLKKAIHCHFLLKTDKIFLCKKDMQTFIKYIELKVKLEKIQRKCQHCIQTVFARILDHYFGTSAAGS